MYKSFHVSRAQRAIWAADNPIGDPFGGPAYGEKTDIGSVVGSVVGGVFGSDAASNAADAQVQAAKTASDTQLKMFNQAREDQAPYRDVGNAALNQLALRLGLSPSSGSGFGSSFVPKTEGQLRNELLPQYTTGGTQMAQPGTMEYMQQQGMINNGIQLPSSQPVVNEAALNAAVQKAMQEQAAYKSQLDAQLSSVKQDPNYGSLLRQFSASDLAADPVYQSGLQFGLDEGRNGVNNHFAASGNMLSGAALKALTRFGNDYASTKANDAYNRYNNSQNQIYNRLAGVSGTGQTAATNIASQGISTGNQLAQNTIAAGDARGASYINQNNAMQGMLGGLYKGFKSLGGLGGGSASSGGTIYNNDGSINYDASGYWDLNSMGKV